MKSWTLLEMKNKVQMDLDLEDEIFITPTELVGYFNEAIDDAEAQIHTLYEDYYLTFATIAFVQDTSVYPLPADIYANKIRTMNYENGSTKYEIKRWRKKLSLLPLVDPSDDYMYLPINTTAAGYQLKLLPAARETGNYATLWYIRNAKVLVDDTDTCDIPEFMNYIFQYVKMRCYEKEGHPNTSKAIQDTKDQRDLMIQTLTNMVDDEDDTIPKDTSFYEDFDSNDI